MQVFEQHPHEPHHCSDSSSCSPLLNIHGWFVQHRHSAMALSEAAETLLRHTIPLPHRHLGKPIQISEELHSQFNLRDPKNSSRIHTIFYSLPFSSFWELQEKKRIHTILRISGSVINEKLSNRCGNYNALWEKVFNGTIQSTSRVFNPLELILHLLYYNWNVKT